MFSKTSAFLAVIACIVLMQIKPLRAEESLTLKEYLSSLSNIPKFEDYPIETKSFQPAKNVDLTSDKKGRMFKTRIREGFQTKPVAANKYAIARAGCGTACVMNWVINKETGKIIGSFVSSFDVGTRLDSALIVNGYDTEMATETKDSLPGFYQIDYLKIENDKLKKLKTIKPTFEKGSQN